MKTLARVTRKLSRWLILWGAILTAVGIFMPVLLRGGIMVLLAAFLAIGISKLSDFLFEFDFD